MKSFFGKRKADPALPPAQRLGYNHGGQKKRRGGKRTIDRVYEQEILSYWAQPEQQEKIREWKKRGYMGSSPPFFDGREYDETRERVLARKPLYEPEKGEEKEEEEEEEEEHELPLHLLAMIAEKHHRAWYWMATSVAGFWRYASQKREKERAANKFTIFSQEEVKKPGTHTYFTRFLFKLPNGDLHCDRQPAESEIRENGGELPFVLFRMNREEWAWFGKTHREELPAIKTERFCSNDEYYSSPGEHYEFSCQFYENGSPVNKGDYGSSFLCRTEGGRSFCRVLPVLKKEEVGKLPGALFYSIEKCEYPPVLGRLTKKFYVDGKGHSTRKEEDGPSRIYYYENGGYSHLFLKEHEMHALKGPAFSVFDSKKRMIFEMHCRDGFLHKKRYTWYSVAFRPNVKNGRLCVFFSSLTEFRKDYKPNVVAVQNGKVVAEYWYSDLIACSPPTPPGKSPSPYFRYTNPENGGTCVLYDGFEWGQTPPCERSECGCNLWKDFLLLIPKLADPVTVMERTHYMFNFSLP